MVCPKCGKEGAEPGDVFCPHCGFSLATPTSVPERAVGLAQKKPGTVTNSDASKGLQLFGTAIFVVAALLAPAVALWVGLPNFGASVLPWLFGAIMVVGLVMIFIGYKLRHGH
ncbi:MAG: zinc ribbon domain-containing protein [Terriglobia bacterium]